MPKIHKGMFTMPSSSSIMCPSMLSPTHPTQYGDGTKGFDAKFYPEGGAFDTTACGGFDLQFQFQGGD